MLARTCRIVAVVAAASVSLLGIVILPELLWVWAVAAAMIGGIAATWSHIRQPAAGAAKRVGAVVSAATMALGFAVAGSIVLFGIGAVWVVPMLLGLGAPLGWRHRRSWIAALAVLVEAKPAAAPPTKP